MTLEHVLNAASVAVVGASKNETKRGYQTIRTLLSEKYEGEIYPVNPREPSILGLKCYKKVSDIKPPVEFALIATPAKIVPAVLEDCGRKGIKGAVVLAGGFGETGDPGKQLEDQIVSVAKEHGMRLIGPNTSGMINPPMRMNLVGIRDVSPDEIALLSQSGNMALTLITEARLKIRSGFSYYVGVGNEADIKFHEYLEFFRNDPKTKAVLMYVEGMRMGREFLQQAYKTTVEKPVVLLKSGRSATGRKSAGSHTGALAGISQVAKGAFQRAGIIVIDNSDQLFPAAEALANLPQITNNSVAILADNGGHATIAADVLTDLGLRIPELDEKTQARLREILPAVASVVNPVDVAGGTDDNPSLVADCARILLRDKQVGGLLIVGLFGGYGIRFAESLALMEEDAAHQMGKMVQKHKKLIIIHSLFGSVKPHSLDLLRYYGVPITDSLYVACKCIGVLAEYGSYLRSYYARVNFVLDWDAKATKIGKGIIQTARQEGRQALLEFEAKEILASHGAPVSGDRLATTAEDAAALSKQISGPVVLKLASPDILHKSDAGGVKLKLCTPGDVKSAFHEIVRKGKEFQPDADIRGCIVSPMARPGLEVIIGTKIDEQFGPVICTASAE